MPIFPGDQGMKKSQGLNDYDTIFKTLAAHGYKGWVSIEDGMNGMGEMAESLAFLRQMSTRYFSE